MSDETTQELNRDADLPTQVKVLRARTRDGSLSDTQLEFAAYLGHPAARALLGDDAPPIPAEPKAWAAGLEAFEAHPLACSRIALCAARLACPAWDAQRPDDARAQRFVEAMTRRILSPDAEAPRLPPRPFKQPLPGLEQVVRVLARALHMVRLATSAGHTDFASHYLLSSIGQLAEALASLGDPTDLRRRIAHDVGAWALGDDPLPDQLAALEAVDHVDPVAAIAFPAPPAPEASATERAMHAALDALRPSTPAELEALRAGLSKRLEAGSLGATTLLNVEYCPTPCVPQRLVDAQHLDLSAILAQRNPEIQEPNEEFALREQNLRARLAEGPHGYAAAVFFSGRLNADRVRPLAERLLAPLAEEAPELLSTLRTELDEAAAAGDTPPEELLLMAIFGERKTLGQCLVDALTRATTDGALTWPYLNESIAWALFNPVE